MSDHLPECFRAPSPFSHEVKTCICKQLRACEQRVREDEHIRTLDYVQTGNTVMNVFGTYYGQGYADGVQAARDAVAAMVAVDEGAAGSDYLFGAKDALALIDNLITKNSGENYG